MSPVLAYMLSTLRETPTAQVSLSDHGILIVRIRKGAHQSPVNARENLAATVEAAGGTRRPLLVDISGSPPLDAETRHLYSGEALVSTFTALGLLVNTSPLGRMMGNVYLHVARPGIPTRLFTGESMAMAWLKGYLL